MDKFVARQNVLLCRSRLDQEIDPGKRAFLRRLLVAEEDKLACTMELFADIEQEIRKAEEQMKTLRQQIAELEQLGRKPNGEIALLEAKSELHALYVDYRHKFVAQR